MLEIENLYLNAQKSFDLPWREDHVVNFWESGLFSLHPVIGYDKAAEIAYKAFESGKTVREIATEEKVLNKEQLDKLLDPEMMTKPSK